MQVPVVGGPSPNVVRERSRRSRTGCVHPVAVASPRSSLNRLDPLLSSALVALQRRPSVRGEYVTPDWRASLIDLGVRFERRRARPALEQHDCFRPSGAPEQLVLFATRLGVYVGESVSPSVDELISPTRLHGEGDDQSN